MKRVFGYARVSSSDQNCARQVAALRAAGVPRRRIYTDYKSGSNFDRPGWKKLKDVLRPNDLLMMQTLDRFGRSYDEVIAEWDYLVNESGVDIKILDNPLLDTTNSERNLTGRFIFDIVLRLLSYLAETERSNIRERQRQGIAIAKKRGVKFGRPRIVITSTLRKCLRKVAKGKMSVAEAVRKSNVSETTIRRMIRSSKCPACRG